MPGWHITMLYLLMWFWGFKFRSICFHSKFFNPLSPVSSPSAPTFCQGISKDEEEGKLWPVHSTLVSVTLCLLSSLLPQQTFSGMYPKYVYTRLFFKPGIEPAVSHVLGKHQSVYRWATNPSPMKQIHSELHNWENFLVILAESKILFWQCLKTFGEGINSHVFNVKNLIIQQEKCLGLIRVCLISWNHIPESTFGN